MSKLIRVQDYVPNKSDNLFFDANIWLNLFSPTGDYGNKNIIRKVNQLYGDILKEKCTIYTSSLIISEFFNAYSRIMFNIQKEKEGKESLDYKRDFRPTNEYRELAENIKTIINEEILDISDKLDDNFSNIDIGEILDINDSYDFNDAYFCSLCSINNIKIVSADKDLVYLPNRKSDLILVL